MPHTIPTTIHWHGLLLPCRVDPYWQDAVRAGDPTVDDRPEWDSLHPGVEPTPQNLQRVLDANAREVEARAIDEVFEELAREYGPYWWKPASRQCFGYAGGRLVR